MKGRLGLVAALFLLAACATPKPAPERASYDLGRDGGPGVGGAPALRVEVVLPAWLDGGDITYRLDYDDAAHLRRYAGSRWAGRPSQLIAARLSAAFAPGPAKCTLRLELDEFAQRFASATASAQQLSGRWRIAGPGGDRLADGVVRLGEPAGGDAPSGVRAAGRLVDRLSEELRVAAAALPACAP